MGCPLLIPVASRAPLAWCSPQGSTCAGAAAAPATCAAATANPYLGTSTGCTTCAPVTSRYTSLAGAAYCTVPYFDRMCGDLAPYNAGGYEWDESAAACVKCRPGTYRSLGMLTTTPDCQEW